MAKCFLCYGAGKMPCIFCDDGMIVQRVTTPPREMPIKCLEPSEVRAKEIREEHARQSEAVNVVSQWIEQNPSVAEAIEEERAAIVASEPPTFGRNGGNNP